LETISSVPIDQDKLQKFRVQDNDLDPTAAQDSRPNEPTPKSRRVIEYNNIDTDLFKAIGEVECFGSYGTKIETLIRHLLYLQKHEPRAKSIVFSAWADSLRSRSFILFGLRFWLTVAVIDHALKSNGIPSIRIDKGGRGSAAKLFDQDPGLRVMLLHGERENAGLNIVCASRVFLLESVVNHAFEVQGMRMAAVRLFSSLTTF
jgi:E3 ubiquitin-protein ligase SHPRH